MSHDIPRSGGPSTRICPRFRGPEFAIPRPSYCFVGIAMDARRFWLAWSMVGAAWIVSTGCATATSRLAEQTPTTLGRYAPTAGFKVADTEYGDLNIRLFAYLRYLNQRLTDPTYTNAFGATSDI